MENRDKTSVGALDDLAASFGKAHDDYDRFASLDELDTAYTAGIDAVHDKDAPVAAAPKAEPVKVIDTTGYGVPHRPM